MSQTIDTLAIEIEANAMNSVDGVRKLSRALSSLATSISKVEGAGIGNVANSLNNMSGAFSNVNASTEKVNSGTKKYTNTLPTLINHTNKASKSTKSLAYYFGKFYANMFLAIRGVKALGKSVSSTMDYMESFNFWDVAITSATTKTNEWEELGYENAQAYGEAFKQGLADFNRKMSGFQTDVKTGDISLSGQSSLGINITDLTTFQAEIVSVTSSLGLCTSISKDTAKALSMLTADMSSLKNIDLDTVMKNFQSGLIGQSRSLYKYGIDITNATLQTYAYKYGVEKAVSEMTQAEKMQLRMLAILDQSKVAWGDLANTINQPANQFRVLKNGIQNLAITIGKLLMPVVSATLPYLNAMVKALQTFFTWLAKVLGVELKVENAGTGTSDIFDGIEDSAEDATDAVNSLKKSMTQLGIDELNINNPNSDSGSGTGATGGGIDLSNDISKALAEYEAAWEEAYANMTDKATEMADAIVKAFKEKDYKSIGTYISKGITKALQSINWDKVYSVAGQFGSGFAEFLNGLITPELFGSVGSTIAGALNTAITTALSFGETFDFENAGKSIGTGINKFFENFDTKDLAKTLSVWANGIFKAINSAIDTVEWDLIGEKIVDFVSNLEIAEIVVEVGKLLINLIDAKFEFEIGFQKGIILALAEALGIDTEEGSKFKMAVDLIMDFILDVRIAAKENLKEKVKKFIDTLFNRGNDKEQKHGGSGISIDIGVNRDSLNNSKKEVIKWSDIVSLTITTFKAENLRKIIEWTAKTYEKFKEWKENVSETVEEWKEDVSDKFEKWKENVAETVDNWKKDVENKFTAWKTNVTTTVSSWKTTIEGKFSAWKTNVETTIKTWKDGAEKKFNEWKTNVTTTVENWRTTVEGKFSTWKKNVETTVGNWKTNVEDKFSNFKKNTYDKVKQWKEDVEGKFTKFKSNVEDTVGKWQTTIEGNFSSFKTNTYDNIKQWKKDAEGKFTEFKKNTGETISKWYDEISAFFGIEKWSFSGVKEGLSSVFSGAIDTIKSLWNNFAKWINQKLTIKIDTNTVIGSGISTVLGTDSITLGSLPTFANGGITSADIFAANENGVPELIGTIGRKTAIASGTEVTGIADAVYNTANEEIRLLREQNALLTKILAKDTSVNIGDKAIAQANIRGQRQLGMTLRTT